MAAILSLPQSVKSQVESQGKNDLNLLWAKDLALYLAIL